MSTEEPNFSAAVATTGKEMQLRTVPLGTITPPYTIFNSCLHV